MVGSVAADGRILCHLMILRWLYRPYRRQASSHRVATDLGVVGYLWELACRR
ncbi:hypothetical protein D3C81_2170940 [compost metagenome]